MTAPSMLLEPLSNTVKARLVRTLASLRHSFTLYVGSPEIVGKSTVLTSAILRS